jgi:hypothetical protein
VPTDHRLRLYYKQRFPPIEEPCQNGQAYSRCGIYSPWQNAALLEKSQLPPKK